MESTHLHRRLVVSVVSVVVVVGRGVE